MTGGRPERPPARRGAPAAAECPGRTGEDPCREPGADLVGAIIRAAPRAAAICTPPEPPGRS
ncbi:hypothetical protein E3E14_13775 [Streptomyces sp. ICN441]|uniref:Uncharacterized protein n=1 Tax=Streptomyces tirandamycinicus TaxID=2174846 RepID=A0A2S1SMD1_9ACTN|nr:hypothetical protein DDW44_01325 [Streptomyces tirandamycinicus]TFE50666.1 hypothetical protein E3E14_13775 [Streptomyces sp. ICN441]